MFSSKSKKEQPNPKGLSSALVPQDPRMKVRTASAQSETTNTTEQSETIYDNDRNKVIQQTVRQTVTHQKTARVIETSIRRTPTKEDWDELLSAAGVNAFSFTSATPLTKMETTVTQKNGRTQTSFVQQQAAKFHQTGAAGKPNTTTTSGAGQGAKKNSSTSGKPKTTVSVYTDQYTVMPSPLTLRSPAISTTISKVNSSAVSPARTVVTYNSPLSKPSNQISGGIKLSTTNVIPSARPTTTPTFQLGKTEKTTPTATTNYQYVSPYRNGARGPLANSSYLTYGKSQFSLPTAYAKHGVTDANPLAGSPKPLSYSIRSTPLSTPHATTQPLPTTQITQSLSVAGQKSKLKPGIAYIFNTVDFADKERFEKRDGSDYDANIVREAFEKYKLKVDTIKNPTVKKIKDTVKSMTKKDYSNYSCLIIVILSHGTFNDSVAASDAEYNINETILYPILDIPSLKEKPKIFIIQACKGGMVPGEYKTDASTVRGSPSEILKCYSTYEGYVAYRTSKGSPFVQALCNEIKLKGQNTDIERLMKSAIETVKNETRSKQIPCMTTNLTKPFVFGNYV
ncbi:unnamed protein product [Ceratitis capitata]|uniref:(Mediterranean fruit fly) hypothetical protein n=1 Tax=Ceratitis capitata TaxID=7213 RepID=W8BS75_CERCA|nr:unnamed protein product [Ceratitis capitata]